MSKHGVSARLVGNDFFVPAPRLQPAAAAPVAVPKPAVQIPVMPDSEEYNLQVSVRPAVRRKPAALRALQNLLDFMHEYSVGTFALLFLLVGSTGIQVAAAHQAARIAASAPTAKVERRQPVAGLNTHLPASELNGKLAAVTGQNITVTIGDKPEVIPAETIKSWMHIVTHAHSDTSYIHVKQTAVLASLQELAKKHAKAPINQVSVMHGGVSSVISPGQNGLKVADPGSIAKDISKHMLAGGGLQFNLPTETVPFASVTPSAFDKLIEVNLASKQMYLYDKGQLIKSYPISAGAPETPTPIGQYKIYSQLRIQDMWGYNPNGTKYFQPKVKWISYFKAGGYAIHGNYWRPQSWFGVRNSSHGCVSLPDAQAKEVYDWADIGTTIITHV